MKFFKQMPVAPDNSLNQGEKMAGERNFTKREFLKISSLALAGAALPKIGSSAETKPIDRKEKKLTEREKGELIDKIAEIINQEKDIIRQPDKLVENNMLHAWKYIINKINQINSEIGSGLIAFKSNWGKILAYFENYGYFLNLSYAESGGDIFISIQNSENIKLSGRNGLAKIFPAAILNQEKRVNYINDQEFKNTGQTSQGIIVINEGLVGKNTERLKKILPENGVWAGLSEEEFKINVINNELAGAISEQEYDLGIEEKNDWKMINHNFKNIQINENLQAAEFISDAVSMNTNRSGLLVVISNCLQGVMLRGYEPSEELMRKLLKDIFYGKSLEIAKIIGQRKFTDAEFKLVFSNLDSADLEYIRDEFTVEAKKLVGAIKMRSK